MATFKELKSGLATIGKELGDLHEFAEQRNNLVQAEFEALVGGEFTAEDLLYAEANSLASDDVETARINILWAWNDHGPCTRFWLCFTYIDSVGIKFDNGDFGPIVNIQRLTTSAHDCIQKAKDEKGKNHRAMAVQWVMASQIHNKPLYDWLKGHGDAVIAALDLVP